MKKTMLMSAVVGLSVLCFAFMPDKKPWNAPADAAGKANPQKGPESIANGKALFAKHCQSCHGKTGMGDAKPAFLIRKHGRGGVDGVALGFAPCKGSRTVDAVLLDQPVNFTHKQQIDRFVPTNASGTLLTRAI